MIRPALKTTLAFAGCLLALTTASTAQHNQQSKSSKPAQSDKEILVLGVTNPGDLPVKTRTVPVVGPIGQALTTDAERFQRCATPPKPTELARIVDHGPSDTGAQHALHDWISQNQACYLNYPYPAPDTPYFGDCNPHQDELNSAGPATFVCRAVYDRGQLFERAIKNLGNPYQLADALSVDGLTFSRFVDRERRRNVGSAPADRRYFGLVSCMVALTPSATARLLQSKIGSLEEAEARQRLIGYAEACLGHPATVRADPGQFRAYAAEAFYNWLVAATDRDSLVVN